MGEACILFWVTGNHYVCKFILQVDGGCFLFFGAKVCLVK